MLMICENQIQTELKRIKFSWLMVALFVDACMRPTQPKNQTFDTIMMLERWLNQVKLRSFDIRNEAIITENAKIRTGHVENRQYTLWLSIQSPISLLTPNNHHNKQF